MVIYLPYMFLCVCPQTCIVSPIEDRMISFISGTERWIKSLNLTLVKPFRPWFGKIFLLLSVDLRTYALYSKIQPYCQVCFCTSYVHSTLPSSAFDGQLAGHAVEYSDLTYVLVAGAGHNVSREKLDV